MKLYVTVHVVLLSILSNHLEHGNHSVALRSLASFAEGRAGDDPDLRSAAVHVFRHHGAAVYRDVMDNMGRRPRVDEMVWHAAELYPGALPSRETVGEERGRSLRDQRGAEMMQAAMIGGVLADPESGRSLIETMLDPGPNSLAALQKLERQDVVELDVVRLERRGPVGVVTLQRPDRLNAENDATAAALETAVDLVLHDSRIRVGVLRGSVTSHPRYEGRRVFSSGLDLTELYYGGLSYLFFIVRELGFVAKMYRGPKPWLAAVETFAVGGGCQLLLVMDRVVAANDAELSLPAGREGILPGAANLRLWRRVGGARARQAILFEERWPATSPQGRLLCDEVVQRQEVDAGIDRGTQSILQLGSESVAANRQAIAEGEEPLDAFRSYMARYAIDQAVCLHSESLAANLERKWLGRERRAAYQP